MIKEENEITVFEVSSRENSVDIEHLDNLKWNDYLGLTNADKSWTNNGKLSSNHIEAVNKLLKQRVNMNSLQITEKVPVYCPKDKRWKTVLAMDPVQSPACQIHHNHNDHWVCSIYHKDSIYLLDSLGND